MSFLPYEMYAERIERVNPVKQFGKVSQVVGLVIESIGPAVSIGRLCNIENREVGSPVKAEVVGFRDNRLLLMPYGPMSGITPGAIVTSTAEQLRIPVSQALVGRVLGGLGQPLDGKGPISSSTTRAINGRPGAGNETSPNRRAASYRHQGHRHYGGGR